MNSVFENRSNQLSENEETVVAEPPDGGINVSSSPMHISTSLVERCVNRLMAPYRQASSCKEQIDALEELGQKIDAMVNQEKQDCRTQTESTSSEPELAMVLEELAYRCIVEIPIMVDIISHEDSLDYNGKRKSMARTVDNVLDHCGVFATISACATCLKLLSAFSKEKMKDRNNNDSKSGLEPTTSKSVQTRVLRTCLATIRRMLCTVGVSECNPGTSPQVSPTLFQVSELASQSPFSFSLSPAMDRWAGTMIFLLPQLIANACHAMQVHLPSWSVQTRLYPRLVEAGVSRYCQFADNSSATANSTGSAQDVKSAYVASLIRQLVCRRSADAIATGIHAYFATTSSKLNAREENRTMVLKRLSNLLQNAMSKIAPQESAILLRSMIQRHVAGDNCSEDEPTTVPAMITARRGFQRMEHDSLSLYNLCVHLISSTASSSLSWNIQEAFVRLMAFSSTSIQPGPPSLDRECCRITMILLSQCESRAPDCPGSEDDDEDDFDDGNSSSDDEEDSSEACQNKKSSCATMRSSPIRRHVRILLESWSQPTFVQRTDRRLQRHVSILVRYGLSLCFAEDNKSTDGVTRDVESADDMTLRILEGVSCRLESTLHDIRRDGMKVAKQLADHLGQELQFEELDTSDGGDYCSDDGEELLLAVDSQQPVHQHKNNFTSTENGDQSNVQSNSHLQEPNTEGTMMAKKDRQKSKPKKEFRTLDPDAEYFSDDDEDGVTTTDEDSDAKNSSGNDDQSTIWEGDDELIPYELEDDEEDLRETPIPLSLLECLTLLRAVETEETAYSQIETGLMEVSRLVRSRPADLPDLALPLAMQLLRMENKFNIQDFAKMCHNALCSLLVQEPVSVGQKLIKEIFEDGALHDRFNVLAALGAAARELSGDMTFEEPGAVAEKRRLVHGMPISTTEQRFTSMGNRADARSAKLESQTRWKRSPTRRSLTAISNQFASIAPSWFYAILAKFLERKNDTTLWADFTGSQLLANLFFTLATILESAGSYSQGSKVMAQDLFDLVWSFRTADVAEIRSSVLIAVSASIAHLPQDAILTLLLGNGAGQSTGSLQQVLIDIAKTDPDEGCRDLATSISLSFRQTSQCLQDPMFLY